MIFFPFHKESDISLKEKFFHTRFELRQLVQNFEDLPNIQFWFFSFIAPPFSFLANHTIPELVCNVQVLAIKRNNRPSPAKLRRLLLNQRENINIIYQLNFLFLKEAH